MAYTPTDWQTGDIITADKLNNMEDGIENALEAPDGEISEKVTFNSGIAVEASQGSSMSFKRYFSNDAGSTAYTGIILGVYSSETNKDQNLVDSVIGLTYNPTPSNNYFYVNFFDKPTSSYYAKNSGFAIDRNGVYWKGQSLVSSNNVENTLAAAYREGVESIA